MSESNTKQTWIIYCLELNGPNIGSASWDNNVGHSGENWTTNALKAKQYETYQVAWNRMQYLYSQNKQDLNKRTYGMVLTKTSTVDGDIIDPISRANELFEFYSRRKFR